jgi:hypothetical protein
MLSRFEQINTVDDLREFVNETICGRYQLQMDAFEMTERILHRSGKPCGIYFCLHGPRAVKFSAIWETDHNQVLFYNSTGQRFQKTQLLSAPALERVAA